MKVFFLVAIVQVVYTYSYFFFVHLKGVDCGRLLPPKNGSLVGEETTFPNHVEIRCDKGFILRGSQRRTCQADRTWSGTTASCQGITEQPKKTEW